MIKITVNKSKIIDIELSNSILSIIITVNTLIWL